MSEAPKHSASFIRRRFINWFPMGLTYAFLYMGRYNLTVAKTSLGELMTKEDFGVIFGIGTITYAIAFLVNGPLIDRIGGKRGIVISATGAGIANLLMGLFLMRALDSGGEVHLRTTFSILYALNMYFQSYGAVSIVKVNAHWFHVGERGGFSGIFGTMISSGIFLAFTVNSWLLSWGEQVWEERPSQWVVFFAPAVMLAVAAIFEFFVLRDRPGLAGHKDFNTGDASSDDEDETPIPVMELYKKILTNPIIWIVASIEFCTGVLRNGVMHWFPIYAKEVWALPKTHVLVRGDWGAELYAGVLAWHLFIVMFVVAAISFTIASRQKGARKAQLIIFGALAFLAPFFAGGWGGLLMVAGVIGGNVAGWVSDVFFQSRRGPSVAGLYGILVVGCIAMYFTLGMPEPLVAEASADSGLEAGDRILTIDGAPVEDWADVREAVLCHVPVCQDSVWDAKDCVCSTKIDPSKVDPGLTATAGGPIVMTIERNGTRLDIEVPDPEANQRAGDKRKLRDRPQLPMSPLFLGAVVFMISLCVIGSHGLLSGTATMDFGGRKAAGTAVGVIDGFVYAGTAVQSISLGYLTSADWSYWPLFLLPFAILGFYMTTKIWHAKPKSGGGH